MHLLYSLGIWLYSLLLSLIAPLHPKAKLWVVGRRGLFERLEQTVEKGSHPIWFHFASLGEFEQGRSVMEAIKQKYPTEKIIITFFSPSGYEIRKNTALADYVFYLPSDTPRNVRRFLDIVQPKMAIFTKYEYWYYYFKALKERSIPLLMISAIFREEQIFFKWYGGFFRSILKNVNFFFTQNVDSVLWLKSIGIVKAGLAGDTRFDRVVQLPKQRRHIPEVEQFLEGSPSTLIAGSTWLPDEKLLADLSAKHKDMKMVLAPHEVHEGHLAELEALFPAAVFFSKFGSYSAMEIKESNILVIDNIGILSSLYGYGQLAYIGGGFGAGIHNTLEAATYGLPVIFGPKYHKFKEAVELLELGAGFSIRTADELAEVYTALADPDKGAAAGTTASRYVQQHAGASQIIIKYIAQHLTF